MRFLGFLGDNDFIGLLDFTGIRRLQEMLGDIKMAEEERIKQRD